MPRIDRGLMLTCGPSLSKRASDTLTHLAEVDVPAEPFYGLNGSVTGVVTTHTYELDNPGSGYVIGPKTVNMYLGHVMMWRTAWHLDGDAFLFMEDDVRFAPNWKRTMEESDASLPGDWDLAFLGSCCTGGRERPHLGGSLYKVGFAMCLHAYMIRRKALRKMINWCERVDGPPDAVIATRCMPHLSCVAYLPRLADQPGTEFPE